MESDLPYRHVDAAMRMRRCGYDNALPCEWSIVERPVGAAATAIAQPGVLNNTSLFAEVKERLCGGAPSDRPCDSLGGVASSLFCDLRGAGFVNSDTSEEMVLVVFLT